MRRVLPPAVPQQAALCHSMPQLAAGIGFTCSQAHVCITLQSCCTSPQALGAIRPKLARCTPRAGLHRFAVCHSPFPVFVNLSQPDPCRCLSPCLLPSHVPIPTPLKPKQYSHLVLNTHLMFTSPVGIPTRFSVHRMPFVCHGSVLAVRAPPSHSCPAPCVKTQTHATHRVPLAYGLLGWVLFHPNCTLLFICTTWDMVTCDSHICPHPHLTLTTPQQVLGIHHLDHCWVWGHCRSHLS